MELRCETTNHCVELPKPHDGKHIRHENEYRLVCHGEDRRDRVDGEHQVGGLDEQQHDEERCRHSHCVPHRKEAVTLKVGGDRHKLLEDADHPVLVRVNFLLIMVEVLDEHSPCREHQETAEHP